MGKNIYDLLNDVEVDLNEYNEEVFTDIEKRKLKKTFKKSIKKNSPSYKKYIVAASITLLLMGLFTTNLGNNVLAYANTIAYDIASYLGIEKSLDEYKTVVNKSVTKKGLSIKLNEVILDHNELVVSTTLTTDEDLKEGSIILDSSIYINGKRMKSSGSSGSSKQLDNHTVEDLTFYDLEANLSGDLNIKIVFSNPLVEMQEKSGRWVFEFKTSGDELTLDTKEILLDYDFTLENSQQITLENYTSNDLGQKIYFSKSHKATDYDMVLRGHDDLGNNIEFYMSRTRDCNGIFKLETIDGNLNKNAKRLFLIPYAVKFPEQSGKLSHDFKKIGKEFTIDLLK